VSEEMLHLSLAGNILKAIGGTPKLYSTEVIPKYPCNLPFHTPELYLELAAADKDQVHKFIQVLPALLFDRGI
jgi:hypothetical protein